MIKKITFCTLLFIINFAITSVGQQTEENLVRQTFDGYKSAILNDKGEEASNYVDSTTIRYYTDIIDVVKNADSSRVDTLPLIDKITVFSIRHRATKDEILSMNGKDLFVYAIKNGMVGKNSVANNSVGNIKIDKTFAKGQLLVNGRPAPLYFEFHKENGKWKLDLTSLFPVSNITFKKMVDESGENENDFLFTILENLTGRKPGPEIWQKIN